MKATLAKQYVNADDGVEGRVWANEDGTYNVTLFDLDAEQTVTATARIRIPSLDDAIKLAKSWANVA